MSEQSPTESALPPLPARLPHIVPRTIPGAMLHADARGAMDWGWQGLLAYASNYTVVVADPVTQQLVQTLNKHAAIVTKVRWQRSHLDARFAYRAVLATADNAGHIVVWNVREGFSTMLLHDGVRPIADMNWVYHMDGCGHLLLALHAPSSLILWDTDNGNKIWKKTFNEQILSFDFDPFDTKQLVLLCPSVLLFMEDFSVAKCPADITSKLQLSTLRSNGSSSTPATPTYDEKSTRNKLKQRVLDLVTGDIPGPEEPAGGAHECLQLSYLRSCRHTLLLVQSRQLLLLDTRSLQTLTTVPTDKSGSPFVQVLPCSRTDALFTLCENGVATLRCPSAGGAAGYEPRAQTDGPRLTRQLQLSAGALEPTAERRLAVLLSTGRLLLWQLVGRPPAARLLLSGMLTPGPAAATVIRMCPPLTTKNWQEFVPRLACGTASGALLVLDVARGSVEAELAAHSCSVRGIEWCGLTSLLSWARPAAGPPRNELLLTDVRTGRWRPLRRDSADSQPISAVRVSHLKQYCLVTFGTQPAELWDLVALVPLRTLPGRFPPLTALAWSPVHNVRRHAADRPLAREHFVFTDPAGQMYHFAVEGSQMRDGTRVPADPGIGTVSDIAWKGDQLVLGDTAGQLCVWELSSKLSHILATHCGAVKKLKFAPGRGNMKLLVFSADGVDIWDTRTDQRISQLRSPRDVSRVVDCDWAASDKPVLLTADNCVRVFDLDLVSACSPTDMYQYGVPVCHPCLMSLGSVSTLEQYLFRATAGPYTGNDAGVRQFLDTLPAEVLCWLEDAGRPAVQRGLVAAQLLGNESAARLWRVAAHYLSRQSLPENSEKTTYIAADFDLLCDSETYLSVTRSRMLARLELESVTSDELTSQLILLGETEWAAQLLLDTETTSPDYYTNCLKACVLASGSTAATESGGVAKLVATSLIAAGHVHKGVEILCAIGQSVDGCRYLQSSGLWEEAVVLARCSLSPPDAVLIITKHADHLISTAREREAALFLLSAGQFGRAAELVRRRDSNLHQILELAAAQ